VTKGLLWTEYLLECKSVGLKPYSISQFNSLFRVYEQKHKLSMKGKHAPGEVLELDWSGSSLLLSNQVTDEAVACHLFVAAFPYSNYFYAEAFPNENIHSWIGGIVHALTFFGGAPIILRPDNLKTATIKSDKYEPELNTAMVELAEYYRTVVVPTRVRSPRDKNVVENAVGIASRHIIAALRNQRFFSLEDMNTEIWQRLDTLNAASFTKKEGSRQLLFDQVESKELLPLPSKPFELFERHTATVAPDYHIQFASAFYSVPPNYIKSKVLVKANPSLVRIYNQKGQLIAEHERALFRGEKKTSAHHIPVEHKHYLSWSGDYFLSQAQKIGEATSALIEKVLHSREFEVQSYRTCAGILRIASRHGSSCLEHACLEALETGLYTYKAVNTIAKTLSKNPPSNEVSPAEISQEIDVNELYCIHTDGGQK
jgi:hypothetical protein